MAIEIHPVKIYGSWDIGYALDRYVTSSKIIYNGNEKSFDNKYSTIGKLLHELKYHHIARNVNDISEAVVLFLAKHPEMTDFDTIIPVPATAQRDVQPVYEIA